MWGGGGGALLFPPSPRSQKENSLYKVRWFCAVGGSHFKSGLNCVCIVQLSDEKA